MLVDEIVADALTLTRADHFESASIFNQGNIDGNDPSVEHFELRRCQLW